MKAATSLFSTVLIAIRPTSHPEGQSPRMGQTERGSNLIPSSSLCGLELVTSPLSFSSVSSSIKGGDCTNFMCVGGDNVKLWKPRGRCHLPRKRGTPPLSLSESCFVRAAGRGPAGSGWTQQAKTTGREHSSRTASCPRCPGHPCWDFSISSKWECSENAQPPSQPSGRGVFP